MVCLDRSALLPHLGKKRSQYHFKCVTIMLFCDYFHVCVHLMQPNILKRTQSYSLAKM